MRIVVDRSSVRSRLAGLVAANARADYVYSYPPRQSYRVFGESTAAAVPELVARSLRRFEDLNLYVHVPFCRQICRFCNLYAVAGANNDLDGYVDTVLEEAAGLARLTDRKTVTTLYIGGGTPSVLAAGQLERLIRFLLDRFSDRPDRLPPETALEVDPATVDLGKLRDLRAVGINRINLGYQSLVDGEVRGLGRRRPDSAGLALLEQALGVGFGNVCVDLIYGLAGQTDEGWEQSLLRVIALAPPTVCAYALTLRPFTGYSRLGYSAVDGATLYRRYEMANRLLQDAGYRQETHVRWVRDGGGYRQKANHWGLRNVLGVGAGARSYLWEADLRNGYSVRSRSATLRSYVDRVRSGDIAVTDGFLMTDDERRRKATALNLMALDRTWTRETLAFDPVERFAEEFAAFTESGLCETGPRHVTLTDKGVKYRDLLSQTLFSREVRTRVAEFNYDE
ncbi:coproporphyrinogen-III oxidase family protein [Saccharothrix syringae]|uniref:Heme chaperone HemW n=1 Tax=Saccharothrix syringae TaxID=103733 RepID=A0A5Q0GXF5_SACSY|nr:radical SAM protein [Saccharothrix syringae]QFZ18563.1 radical SAM protein [Saccharothrix syringae]